MNTKQNEILLILQEECAEAIQAICKVKRFGMEHNIDNLNQGIADLLCMINLAFEHMILDNNETRVKNRMIQKQERLKQYSSIYHEESLN